jgi:Tfp pilus assembly protein PilP
MIVGKEQVAVMDIPGVGNGLLVKAGDTFMQRKGRIVRIAPDKVVVRWGNRNWDIAPSF